MQTKENLSQTVKDVKVEIIKDVFKTDLLHKNQSYQTLSTPGTVTSLFSPTAITLLVTLANRLMPCFR